ncbi:MAG: glycosyltransferase [Desulfovibrionaceae bacterium]|nr:glycosyltransferase [Desulfovibrionaceae bacterium]
MRVLMFGWEFPPHISGGLGSACEGIVRALTGRGTEVLFVLPRLGGKSNETDGLTMFSASGTRVAAGSREASHVVSDTNTYWKKNLHMEFVDSMLTPYTTPQHYERVISEYSQYRTSAERRISETVPGGEYCVQMHGGYGPDLMSEVFKYSLAARTIAQQNDFDVIHAHDWMAYPAGIMARKVSGKPLIVHVHATEADRSGSEIVRSEIGRIEYEGMHAADKVVAVSHFTKNLIMRVYGVPEHKIEVVHNAVSQKEAKKVFHVANPDGEKQVLFMGRITLQKGPEYFVEAARLVLKVMPNVRFVMAGSGDMLLSMVSRVARYRMGRRFTFTGFLKGAEVENMYAASDLYVMPSVSEPFGIAPLEAMVYDVPVLMSKQSGVSEVVNNALKVDFWDVRKMAASICAVLAYPALGRFMVANCQEELKTIRWDNAAVKLNRIYSELAKRS